MLDVAPRPGDAAAWLALEELRWGGAAVRCPRCDATGACRLLRTRSAAGRATRTGAPTNRRVWQCRGCRRQFSVLSGTALAGTRVPPSRWVAAAGCVVAGTMTSRELAASVGVSRETARQMLAVLLTGAERAGRAVPSGDGSAAHGDAPALPTRDGNALLAAVLRLGAPETAAVRLAAPRRPRPRGQSGPTRTF